MGVFAFVAPILPDRLEAWRRFGQELLGSRRGEYEESRRRLGITRELAWFTQVSREEWAILYLEACDAAHVLARLAASEVPFDRWYRQQIAQLHGLDVARAAAWPASELVFEWPAE